MRTVGQWFRTMVDDHHLEEDVREELAYDSTVGRAPGVDVQVDNGLVTLSGTVYSLAQRHAVEHAVRRVDGVFQVINSLAVDSRKEIPHDDQEIANGVATMLDWTAGVPDGIA